MSADQTFPPAGFVYQMPMLPTDTAPMPHVSAFVSKGLQLNEIYGLIGLKGIELISKAFYTRVYGDTEAPWFRDIFQDIPMEMSVRSMPFSTAIELFDFFQIHNQVTFFVQRFGGDPWYGSMKKDDAFIMHGTELQDLLTSSLYAVHAAFVISPKMLHRWMHHMRNALSEVDLGARGEEIRTVLMDWFWTFGNDTVNCTNSDPKAPHNVYDHHKRAGTYAPHAHAHAHAATPPAAPVHTNGAEAKEKREKKEKKHKEKKAKGKKDKKDKTHEHSTVAPTPAP